MEGGSSWDLSLLLSLLSQGEQQTRQLEANLEAASPDEHCKSLLQQIRSNLEEAISMAKMMDNTAGTAAASDSSPRSNSGSPRSENSDRVFKEHERRELCRKRKTMPKWTSQARVSGSGAAEGLEDGYSWRKYGQKEILGAKHPRGYYRCTHRNSVGCLATKQVQRSDKDPWLFDITYRGEHTCLQKLLQGAPVAAPKDEDSHQNLMHPTQQQQQPPMCLEAKPQAEILELQNQVLSSSFSFGSTPLADFTLGSQLFPATVPLDDNFMGSGGGGFSSPFISPTTTTDSNYFTLPPFQMSSYGGGSMPNISESGFTEIISAATSNSTTNSPRVNAAFMMDHLEFDPVFPFDPAKFF
ncbi:putative WRKY transcription factor 41 [Canna indica]|uniref:WRKY transcription factor 41 n=1 Tax=Canna indica TaxID=4628 RepID=A0AAQ3QD60_9LILI|nr:putative WRKY transcription factor 41 [Canna indica]